MEKRDSEQPFSSLRRWLSRWINSEVILSHITNQLHVFKQLLHSFTLNRNILVHKNDQYSIPAKSGCGLINAEALLGGDTTSVHIKTITTDHDITNTGENCMRKICNYEDQR